MIVLCVTLLLLHPGYCLVPVINVQPGEPATFKCVLKDEALGSQLVYWFKQNVGNDLKFLVALEKNLAPQYDSTFPKSRLNVHLHKNVSTLTILKTIPKDEGMYHCGIFFNFMMDIWSGTYLSVNGKTPSDLSVVQWSTGSGPGDSMSLQCSVQSDSENKLCSGDHSVYWFRVRSGESHPGIIYHEGNRPDNCNHKPDPQSSLKSCRYHFSKTIGSSDDGTYYCAVATCGHVLFGNGTRVQIEQAFNPELPTLVISTFFAISVIANVAFICYIRAVHRKFKGAESPSLQAKPENTTQPEQNTEDEDNLNYARLHFSAKQPRRKQKELHEESVYSQVKSRY